MKKFITNLIDSKKQKQKQKQKHKSSAKDIRVTTFNVENFVNMSKLYDSELSIESSNSNEMIFLDKLRRQDIILIQEWKNDKYEGDLFMYKLNNGAIKFKLLTVDRVAIIYNTEIFDSAKSYYKEVPLIWEAAKMLEQTYTYGRHISNMMALLYPIHNPKTPICVISVHLNSYSPNYHPGFHSQQIQALLDDCLQELKTKKISKFGLIIAGDTNYRTTYQENNKLIQNLLGDKVVLPNNGILVDVCSQNCLNTNTQSFSCVHEPGVAKRSAQFISSNLRNNINPEIKTSFHDSRLDLMATNLKIKLKSTIVGPICNVSDHSYVSAVMQLNNSKPRVSQKQNKKKPRNSNKNTIKKRK
jgi:hypothetical protein